MKSLSSEEVTGIASYSGAFYSIFRALERGEPKEKIIKSDKKLNKDTVDRIAGRFEDFKKGLDKLKMKGPPPTPSLYRGLAVSHKNLHSLLTKDDFDLNGMSSSTSVQRVTAEDFAATNANETDYQGDKCEHKVLLKVNKTVT